MQDNRTLQIKLAALTPGRYWRERSRVSRGDQFQMSFPTVR